MGYLPDATLAALRDCANLGVFFRAATNPVLRLWAGVNTSPTIGIPSLDEIDAEYVGAGGLVNVPDLEILINGLADRVDFSLNGLDPTITNDLEGDGAPVLGRAVHVGIAPLDDDWQPLSPVVALWTGTADYWAETREPQRAVDKSVTHSLTLTTSTGDTSRSRPRLTTFTDSAQQLAYPTDRFFERVSRYVQSYSVPWPRF
jgi:hypothetical protein